MRYNYSYYSKDIIQAITELWKKSYFTILKLHKYDWHYINIYLYYTFLKIVIILVIEKMLNKI